MNQLTEHPSTIANRLLNYINDVDKTKPCNLIMNADALVIEYNSKVTGYKCFDDIGRVGKKSS